MKFNKNYIKYITEECGFHSNKIENQQLTREYYISELNEYETYPDSNRDKDIIDKMFLKFEKEEIDKNELKTAFEKIELQNYQECLYKFVFNDKLNEKNISAIIIKDISKTLLKNFDNKMFKPFTSALNHWFIDKKTQEPGYKNRIGEFRNTDISKTMPDGTETKFRPFSTIEEDVNSIILSTNAILDNPNISISKKIEAIALFHLNYEFIHPFAEGNGRTGRIIADLQLHKIGFISPIFTTKNDENDYSMIINETLKEKEENKEWELFTKLPKKFELMFYGSINNSYIDFFHKYCSIPKPAEIEWNHIFEGQEQFPLLKNRGVPFPNTYNWINQKVKTLQNEVSILETENELIMNELELG